MESPQEPCNGGGKTVDGKAKFVLDGEAEPIRIFDKEYNVGKEGIEVEI